MRGKFALFVAACCLLTSASGSVVTTLRSASPVAGQVHTVVGILLGILCFILGVWCFLDKQAVYRWLGLLIVTATGLEGMTRAVMVHACFAPVLFGTVVAAGLFRPGDRPLALPGASSLRWLITSLPGLILLQIALGAAHRHQMAGVMLHMGGAMLVAGLTLVVSLLLLQKLPPGVWLRSLTTSLVWLIPLQVSLGITVYVIRLLEPESPVPVVLAAAAHVTGGAAVLAATAILAIQYQRTVS